MHGHCLLPLPFMSHGARRVIHLFPATHLSNHEHVHPVQLDARDMVAHREVGRIRRRPFLGSTHTVLVVLDAVDHRELGRDRVTDSGNKIRGHFLIAKSVEI